MQSLGSAQLSVSVPAGELVDPVFGNNNTASVNTGNTVTIGERHCLDAA